MVAVAGRRPGRELRRQVRGDAAPGPGGLLGLELEFSLRSAAGGRVHFGSLIHRLALDGSALDPGDPNAYRCSWGGVITSDGAEAEIATPPVSTRPGFTSQIRAWAQTGVAELRRAVPAGIELTGYSAHFSAAMPARLNEPVCRLYAQTFAASLMLLMERADSPGLLIRPRPGRTELCGEFVEGEPLPAVAAFVAGSTMACAAAIRGRSARTLLPPRLEVRLAPAVHRYGWYVDRGAFGADLHAASRRTLLPRASGGTISAQSHLELAWAAARQALAEDAADTDMRAADAMVTGSLPLPAEARPPTEDTPPAVDRPPAEHRAPPRETPPHLGPRARPGFTLRPVAVTWDFTVFAANGPERTAYVCIPRDSLPSFVDRLEHGALDNAITSYLTRRQVLPRPPQVLSAHRQTGHPGLYDQLGAPAGLLAPERDRHTGRQESARESAKLTLTRPGKSRHPRDSSDQAVRRDDPPVRTRPRFARKALLAAAVLAALLAGAGAFVATLGHVNRPALPPVSFQPSALSFPGVAVNSSTTKSLTMTNNSRSPVTVSQIGISGPDRNDFSILAQNRPVSAGHGAEAIQPALLCPRPLQPQGTCTVTVRFVPATAGARTADLLIYLTSRPRQPWRVAVTGIGTPTRSGPPTTPAPPAVTVSSVMPAKGPAAGGTLVTINGSGFTVGAAVDFGSVQVPAADVTVTSSTQITAISPPGAGTVPVTVGTPPSTVTSDDYFTYQPAVSSIAPLSGSAAGGTSVTIDGSGFTAGAIVDLGSVQVPAADVTVTSSTQITVISPATSAIGSVPVTVILGGVTLPDTGPDQFTYLPAVTSVDPPSGPASGKGPRIEIFGIGFTTGTTVNFGSTSVTPVKFISSTEIVVPDSAGPAGTTVDVTVTVGGLTSAATSADQFTYQ